MTSICPSCGAALESHAAAQVIVCSYCNAASLIYQGELSLLGKVAPLTEADDRSLMTTGQTGRFEGRNFSVLGQLRYDYDDGFWDEWSLFFEDGELGWLQADEGEFTFFDQCLRLTSDFDPPLSDLGIGATIEVEGMRVFAAELGEARVVGGCGQLSSGLSLGCQFSYVDGPLTGQLKGPSGSKVQDQAILLESSELRLLFTGRAVFRNALELD